MFGGIFGVIAIAALGIAGFASDAIGELQPRFGDEKEPRLVGGRGGAFDQIEAGSRHLAVLELQTHGRTQSTFRQGLGGVPAKDRNSTSSSEKP